MPDTKKASFQVVGGSSSSTSDDARPAEGRIARLLSQDLRPGRALALIGTWPSGALHSPDKRIVIATSTSELEDIGRFRYESFFVREGKTGVFADHDRRQFLEPVDELSLNLQYRGRAATSQAAVRLTRANDALSDPHLQSIIEVTSAAATSNTIVCSRLVIRPDTRTSAIVPLLNQVYRSALLSGACYCLLAAHDHMTHMFEAMGFRPFGASVNDPIGGALSILRLDAYDIPYLRRLRSPCLAVADELFSTERDRRIA